MVISNTKVIRAVLNSLVFLRKDFARTKKHQKFQKHRKALKSTKKQPSKRTKRK